MPYRKVGLGNNKIYHVINRSIAKFCIYNDTHDYQRFIDLINFYKFDDLPVKYSYYNKLKSIEKLKILTKIELNLKNVDILAYCLMPNHFHLLLRQNTDNGISNYMRLVQNSYAKYFNIKHHRKGPLFESSFKVVHVENDEQLAHVSRYIHLNPVSAGMIDIGDIKKFPWSSYSEYLNNDYSHTIKKDLILNYFSDANKYGEFVKNQADYQKELQRIKNLILE